MCMIVSLSIFGHFHQKQSFPQNCIDPCPPSEMTLSDSTTFYSYSTVNAIFSSLKLTKNYKVLVKTISQQRLFDDYD